MAPVRATAELLWTSAQTFEGVGITTYATTTWAITIQAKIHCGPWLRPSKVWGMAISRQELYRQELHKPKLYRP